ncbi:serine/threonine-protein kinase [Nocardioides aromaticivorans]|nr:serine/threonine-protein kinase [Nocardioides aromaticivorans]
MPPARPGPPDQLGPYRIVRRLGQGGMGTVYDALDTALDRHVALKVIVPGLAGDPEFRTRFVREARAQASLDSPHVVQVFAHGELDGQLFIATQLVPDGDLGRYLRRHGPLPPGQAAAIVAQVADGLAEAHRVGLVHRDIKPSNVLLRHRGTDTVAYLADFGIAAPAGGAGVRGDLAGLRRLLEACLGEAAAGPEARALRDARSAAEVRDLLRRPAGVRRRGWPVAAAALALAAGATVATVAVVAAMAARDRSEEQGRDAVVRIAHVLEDEAGLDARSAACAARALVDEHGATALAAVERGARPDPAVVDDALEAASGCLW